jgi:hypothetical protein
MSRNIASGVCSSASSIAATPSCATPTIVREPVAASGASGSGLRAGGSRRGVGLRLRLVGRQAETRIRDGDLERAVGLPRDDLDRPVADLRLEPMLDRILDERLQQHRRHAGLLQRLGEVEPPCEPRSHPQRHDLEVRAQLREFAGERRRVLPRCRQRAAQVDDQLVDHRLREPRVDVDERAQVRERVEQHVRFELRAQQPQLRLEREALRLGARARLGGDAVAHRIEIDDEDRGERGDDQRDDPPRPGREDRRRLAEQRIGEARARDVADRDRDDRDDRVRGKRRAAAQPSEPAHQRAARDAGHAHELGDQQVAQERRDARRGQRQDAGDHRAEQRRQRKEIEHVSPGVRREAGAGHGGRIQNRSEL